MTPPKGRGRPAILRTCIVCTLPKKSSQFAPRQTAAVPDRCKDCTKLATAARAAARPAEIEALRAAKAQAKIDRAAEASAHRIEALETRRIERLRASPKVAAFKQQFQQRIAERKAENAVTEFLAQFYIPPCGCCGELSAMRDTMGDQPWCLLCGWGIERTGKCLAHPGKEVFYEGMPDSAGFVLPPELVVMMRPPFALPLPQEQPATEPDQEQEAPDEIP